MKGSLLKKVFALSLAGVMILGLMAGCGKKEEATVDKYNEIMEKGELVVGLSADYAPYEFHAMIDGKDTIVGFDVEIAKEIAKDLGVKLKIEEMEFDAVISALPANKIDVIISGLNPDQKRAKVMDFSEIYYLSEHGILVNSADKDKYNTLEDLNGKKVGVQLASTQEKIAQEKIKDAQLTQLQNVNNLVLELKAGKVDALVVEKPVAEAIIKSNKELVVGNVQIKNQTGGNAVGMPKKSPKLKESIDKTIKRLKEDGSLDKFIIDANDLAAKNAQN